MHGAVEEVLLRHRALIEDALYPLQEHGQLNEHLEAFKRCILDLQHHEPAFWELRVVEAIRDAIASHVGKHVHSQRSRDCDPESASDDSPLPHATPTDDLAQRRQALADATQACAQSSAFTAATERINEALHGALERLAAVLHDAAATAHAAQDRPHFLHAFWDQLHDLDTERREYHEQTESGLLECAQSCSFEAISFDDLHDECGSMRSGPTYDDIPSIIVRLLGHDTADRVLALDDLLQIPILEVVHCGPHFRALCDAVTSLFLLTDATRADVRAKRFVYDLLNEVEDAFVFLDVYTSVLAFAGAHYCSGSLCVDKSDIASACDAAVVSAVDVYRLVLVLLQRIPHHWIHLSSEALARVQLATLQLLVLSPATQTTDTRQIRPFAALALLDTSAQWFAAWLLKTPAHDQLFAAIHESGFVAELLQYLARVRVLETNAGASDSIADAVERRTTQHVLCIVSQLTECRDGRELLSAWQRVPAHRQLQCRQTQWTPIGQIELTCRASENDRVYHLGARRAQGNQDDTSSDDVERLGERIFDAVAMAIVALVLTDPSPLQPSDAPARTPLSCLAASLSKFLARLPTRESIVEAIVELAHLSFDSSLSAAASVPTTRKRMEREREHPWFPFRRATSVSAACALVGDSIRARVFNRELDVAHVRWRSRQLFAAALHSISSSDAFRVSDAVLTTVFTLSRHVLQDLASACSAMSIDQPLDANDALLLSSLAQLLRKSELYRLAQPLGLVPALAALYSTAAAQRLESVCDAVLEHLASLTAHTLGLRALCESGSDTVQSLLCDVTATLLASSECTLAINSAPDEYPSSVRAEMHRLALLRCCLVTRHASASLVAYESDANRILAFVLENLADHRNEMCFASCDREDLCTVAHDLALALTSSVPAALACAHLLVEHDLITLWSKETPVRVHSDACALLSPCSLLQAQLQDALDTVGGPSEKRQRCALHDFDPSTSEWSPRQSDSLEHGEHATHAEDVSVFVQTLCDKMVASIQSSCDRDTALDFVMLSQASWELIFAVEGSDPSAPALSTLQFTRVFGALLHPLVLSKRSRLETASSRTAPAAVASLTDAPTDAQRKLMNQLYKRYCHRLGLKASPTTLHCITRKFGHQGLDCFAVTALMVLDQVDVDEKDVLAFLTCCWSSPSGAFLWPSMASTSACAVAGGVAALHRVASAVELLLERECPECHCSVLALVLQWLRQCFWNYLDWRMVVLYVYLTALHGTEFQVYTVVAVVKHLAPTLHELSSRSNSASVAAFETLLRLPIAGFRFSRWRKLFLRLRNAYHDDVVSLLDDGQCSVREAAPAAAVPP